MVEPPSDERTGRPFERLLRNLPSRVRYRLFKPAYEDLRAEHLVRRQRPGRLPGARLWCSTLFALRVLALVAACYRATPGFLFRRAHGSPAATVRRGTSWSLDMLTRDVRHAFRLFYKQPFFSGAAVFVMALGIGASVVMFTVVDAVLLRPLPFPDANRLVAIEETSEGRPSSVSPVNFYDWERQAQSFSSMAIFAEANMTLATGGEAIAVAGIAVSSRFFPTLGVQMALGRHFSPEDDRAGGPLSVVLSHGLWLRAFGGRHDVVGQQVAFDGFPYTVIGIAPRGVAYPEGAEAWFSLALSDRSLAPTARGAHWVEAIGRLEPGTKIEAAQAEMNRIAANLAAAYPRTNRSSGAKVVDLLESMTGSARPALLLLFGSVGCLLTIACVNVSGLLMVRAAGRRTEAAIRAALGAGRMALVRQVMTESIVLASVAGGIGITMASWGQNLLLALLPSDLPRASAIGLDLRAVLFAMAVALLAGFALGVLPAWHSIRVSCSGALQAARHDGGEAGSPRLRGALVAAEVALALVLLVGAGLTARSFMLLSAVSAGFDPRGVLTFWLSLPEAVYKEPNQVAGLFDRLLGRLEALPGVVSAGAVMLPPLSRTGFGGTFTVDGRPENPADEPRAQLRPATPGYFRTIGLRVIRGRGIEERDGQASVPVAVISETAASRYWPGEDPIGRKLRIHVSAVGAREPVREIVGVVQDVKTGGLQAPAAPVVYVPHLQHLSTFMTAMIRVAGDPGRYANGAVSALRGVDKALVAQDLRTLEEHVARSSAAHRFRAVLLGAFAGSAFVLAVLGLYAVVAYATGRRRHEIGVRVALGATDRDVVRLMVMESMVPVLAGMAVGTGAAFLLSSRIQTLLFGVRPFEPSIVALVALVLGVAALLACYLPARRGTRVNPNEALRAE